MNALTLVGETIAEKYRVDRVLGVGGMGIVVAAQHLELDMPVAIKLLLPQTAANADAVARFSREARASAKIKNEHVTRALDVGKLDDGTPYLVMEYLEGRDLASLLAELGQLPVEQAVDFVLQASEAIAEAHSLGIVHRDLKPANLFMIQRPDGASWIKVLDFGISKMADTSSAGISMTRTSVMFGSPMYMSPEQIRSSRDVGAQTDIWALGVILYELITGRVPFDGESLPELVEHITSGSPPPFASHRADVPEALEQVIFHCLEREVERRFSSIAELAEALLPFAPPRAVTSAERILGATGRHTREPTTAPPVSEDRAPSTPPALGRRGRWVAGLALLLGATATVLISTRRPALPARPASAAPSSPVLASPPSPVVVSLGAARPAAPAVSPAAAPTPAEPAAPASAEHASRPAVRLKPTQRPVPSRPARPAPSSSPLSAEIEGFGSFRR